MSKAALLAQVKSSGGSYVFLTHKGTKNCEQIGRVNTVSSLHGYIASYAAKHRVSAVKVLGGRNIMDEDGPTAVFNVTVKVE